MRIIKGLKDSDRFEKVNLKKRKIHAEELDWLQSQTGSYESLFNKRAIKYRQLIPKDTVLNEFEYRYLILSERTFLKRPVIVFNKKVYVGNSPKEVERAYKAVNGG